MKLKPTVTIGIPAYNEEGNIGHLLKSLVRQNEAGFEIKQIIIVNDASADGTVGELLKIYDKRILLINNPLRSGQSACQNLIFSKSVSDVVVLFEADTRPISLNYIKKLVEPIIKGNKVGIVQGNTYYVKPKTFVGKVIRQQIVIYKSHVARNNNKNVIISSGRGGRAFSRQVYKKLRWPINVPEDTFATLWCRRRQLQLVYQERAACLYRLPESVLDFRRAKQKMIAGKKVLKEYFSESEINGVYDISCPGRMRMFTSFMLVNPIYCVAYVFLKIFAEPVFLDSNFSDYFPVGKSTKYLLNYK